VTSPPVTDWERLERRFNRDGALVVPKRDLEKSLTYDFSAKVARRNGKAFFSKAKEPSYRIKGYLRALLTYTNPDDYRENYIPSEIALESFVRYANGYFGGPLTMVHWIQAVQLIKEGFNWYGNATSLVNASF